MTYENIISLPIPVFTGTAKIIHWLSIVKDITEIKYCYFRVWALRGVLVSGAIFYRKPVRES